MKKLLSTVESAIFKKIDIKNATIKFKDGGTNEITVKVGEGNLTFSENRNVEFELDRGNLDDVSEGDEAPMDVSLDFRWDFLKSESADPATVEEAVTQTGNASDWSSTDSDGCNLYAVDIEVTYDPGCDGKKAEVITLPDFRYETIDHDLREGTVSMSGRCNAKRPNFQRVTSSSGLV